MSEESEVDLDAAPRDAPRPKDIARALRLRAERPPVTRLSRKVLAGLGAIVCIGLGGALIYALQGRKGSGLPAELYSTENRPPADGLQGLPRDYTGIPKLGPPLPGDLGRPILRAQEQGQPVPVPGPLPSPTVDPAEQRRLQETEAARVSRLFASLEARAAAPASNAAASTGAGGLSGTSAERQAAFLNGPVDRRIVSAERIARPASPYLLQAGAVIPAALITGIRSDLPGQITAQVTEPVFDTATGRFLLIPQGTRLIGQYDNDVGFGQRRILLVWNRLIFPDGRSIVLERQPGADPQGYAGLEDGVDYHWGDLAKAAGLSTLLSVSAELGNDDEDRLIRAIRNGGQDTINDAGQQIVRKQLNVPPTLTVRPGFVIRVIVTRDLVLAPYPG
ncbi:TrbI/VirB10 family protein [Chelatococcus reniformis]|uniref:Conjugal transfer protein TraI n=1 Tax=Chelatococcus reniformis TaxID=1494448 RepID=A0A916XRW2_9HYPH|nr:TrbI/VirB10 family protein [Chelatococcus reniformis]GGC94042.1 conjugal transfer protein TraI [Chelatococcus reniformis]